MKTATKRTQEVSQTLLLAIPNDQRPWYLVPHLLKLNILLGGLLLYSGTVGYDTSLMNGLQSLPPWQTFMNHPTGAWLGFIGAIQSLGGLVALPFQAWAANKYGRKLCIIVGYFFIILGVAMQAATPSPTLFILSRLFVGIACSWFGTSAIIVTELAYPTHRAKITGLYNCFFYVGSILSAWTTFGCRNYETSWAWRIPVILQMALPVVALPTTILCPESPRWLVRNNRSAEARAILVKYHAGGDETSTLVAMQMEEIIQSITMETEFAGATSWAGMFKTKGNRHRAYISITLGVAAQWNGGGVVSYYLNLILNSVGIKSVTQQTLINGGLQIWNLILAVVGSLLVELAGRRLLFILSTCIMLVSYIIITALSGSFATTQASSVGLAVIPFLFIYYGGYDIAFTPLLISYPAEIWTYAYRAKGLALTTMCTFLALLFNQFINPIALQSIGWKYYIVYIAILVLILINVWFTYPETKGYALEEVAIVFDGDNEDVQTRLAKGRGETHHIERVGDVTNTVL